MKRTVSILLLIILCVPLCACGNANAPAANAPTSTPQPTVEAAASAPAAEETVQNVTINFATPAPAEETEVVFDEPVVILDNEYMKITVTGKYSGSDANMQVYGYMTELENKMNNKHLMFHIVQPTIDGYMLDTQAGFYGTIQMIAPSAKARTRFYIYADRAQSSVELKSVDDLKNVNGMVQINFSDDGNSYAAATGPNGEFPFENNFPFLNVIP